ncbi:MAG: hypothetical protein OER88_14555, partial [Planctomycetota bacterium]|nr:hypothetical protein [Planctomycetota bacterium]
HADSHEGGMVLECAQCHGQKSWESLHSDGHARFLPLKGAHAEVSCRKCHEKEGAHALEVLGRRDHAARQCQDCHESPHTPSFVQESASLAAIAPSASCVVCHDYDHTEWRDKRVTTTPPQHSASGFDLVAPHAEVKCEECHKTDAPTFAARYPGRKQDDCASCHEDVHRGQFKNSAGAQNGCIDCHERVHFKPHAFTVEKHAQTELPLEGKHVETDCNECHKDPPMNKPRAFEGTSSRCEACHEDAHAGFFGIHDDVLEKHKHGSCAVCHIPSSFRDGVPGASFDHGKWTGFAVRGAHAQTACETCHPRQKEPDRTGRTLGRSHDKFGRYEGCATCHKDPHDGGFDKKTLPKAVEGRKGCARCHTETSFRDFPDGFDHGQWTGFLLGGAHLRAGCAACHTPLRRPAKSGRTWGRAKGAKCADCHDDPHAEQFEVHDNDCEKCHRSAASFADLTFRHNFDSRFRLDETHAQVACAKCHKKEKIKGKLVARYRPLGMKCADCHGAHENPLRRRKRSRR